MTKRQANGIGHKVHNYSRLYVRIIQADIQCIWKEYIVESITRYEAVAARAEGGVNGRRI